MTSKVQPQISGQKRTIAAVMGSASAAALLLATLTGYEGKRNVGYLDIVKVPTACMGDTKDVVVGKFYADAECQARLERQAIVHVDEVKRCTPTIAGNQLVAAGSLTYNIGGAKYCSSTVARLFNAGQLRRACDAFLAWNRAGGRMIAGLARRREGERALCLKGLPA